MTDTNIARWATSAQRGDRFVYHRTSDHGGAQVGELRAIAPKSRTAEQRRARDEAFDAATLEKARSVCLVQRRVATGLHYEAVKR